MNINIKIGERLVGAGQPTYIIAEMSANHLQNYERAKEIMDTSKYENDFDDFLRKRAVYSLLMSAFIWCETDEGHKFWEKLDNEWGRQCERNT